MKCPHIQLKLKDIRTIVGCNQVVLAAYVGVSALTIGKWERNESHPSIEELYLLSCFLSCTMNDLVEFKL